MPDIADEAMEALLVLHHPNMIKAWNPEAPMITYWDISSQVLFSISQKLIQRQIYNYTAILKWLREILIRRNAFLSQYKNYANVGSEIAICKQAHIKLEVRTLHPLYIRFYVHIVFFIYTHRKCSKNSVCPLIDKIPWKHFKTKILIPIKATIIFT